MKQISAKFPGRCLVCRSAIEIGQDILWERDFGAMHVECRDARKALARFWQGCPPDLPCLNDSKDAEDYRRRLASQAALLVQRWAEIEFFIRFDEAGEDFPAWRAARDAVEREKNELLPLLRSLEGEMMMAHAERAWAQKQK